MSDPTDLNPEPDDGMPVVRVHAPSVTNVQHRRVAAVLPMGDGEFVALMRVATAERDRRALLREMILHYLNSIAGLVRLSLDNPITKDEYLEVVRNLARSREAAVQVLLDEVHDEGTNEAAQVKGGSGESV